VKADEVAVKAEKAEKAAAKAAVKATEVASGNAVARE
jgi:hypothetical protein